MRALPIGKPVLVLAGVLTLILILIANVEVLAQPYERSAVLDSSISFDFANS